MNTAAKVRTFQAYKDRQKHRWVKVSVNFLDRWLGLHPIWKIALAKMQLAEKREYLTMFPQGPLIGIVTDEIFNTQYSSVKPLTSTVDKRYSWGIMEETGLPTAEEIRTRIGEQVARLSSADRELRGKQIELETPKEKRVREEREWAVAKKSLRDAIANKLYKAWQVQQKIIGYLSGLYLTKSWKEIYLAHKAILEELEPEGAPGE